MDSSSEEDIVKKKGWALVNKKGSLENSSDEEQLENVAVSKRSPDLPLCQDINTKAEEVEVEEAAYSQSLAPLSFQLPPPESPTLQTPGSNSSSGSTLVSSLPSPLPHLQRDLPINRVEEDLSSVADILKSKVEKEDSQSVDSFEILSEPASGDCEPSLDGQSEDGDDEDFAPLASQNIPQRFTSDSDSDFVRLKASSEMDSAHSGLEEIPPCEMDSAHSGLEEIPPGPSQSSETIISSQEPVLSMGPRPVNAPYQDMRGVSSEEESDHVRIMSRRWPTEDGGFLLVQRFKKLEPDDISTVSSSISDFSSFSMMGNSGRQRLTSDTQEEAGDSDTESEVSNSSYASEEPLPVNMMVQNVPPAVRQYLHKRNDVFNSKLTILAVLVMTAGLTLGIGHFVGSSQMVSHHQSVQEGQKLRLRSLQDELVSCMDRRKEIARLYQEKEKEVNSCAKEKEELVKEVSSTKDVDSSLTIGGEDPQELRLCSGCSDVGMRYSKFCNTRCPADSIGGHSWVAMDMRSSGKQEYWERDGSEGQGMRADQVASSQSMQHVIHGVNYKMPSHASVIGSFVNFVATQAPPVSPHGEGEVLLGESSPLSKGFKGDPHHSAPFAEESEELPVHSSPLNEESKELSAHAASLVEESEALPTQFTSISDKSEELLAYFSLLNEEREVISVESSSLTEVIQDVPGHSVSLEEEDEVAVSAHLVSLSKSHERIKTESQKEESSESASGDAVIDTLMEDSASHPIVHDDTLIEEDSVATDNSRIGNALNVEEYGLHSDVNKPDRGSVDTVSMDVENVKGVQTTARFVTEHVLETNVLRDSDAEWVCVDDAEPEHCHNWIPKAELKMSLEKSKNLEVREEVEHDTGDVVHEKQLQHLDELEPFSVDGQMEEVLKMNKGGKLHEEASENIEGDDKEEREEDALTMNERKAVEEMEETLEGKEEWIWTENDEWMAVDSKENSQDAIFDGSNSEKSTNENRGEPEDHLDVITQALQSAWGIVENASRDIIGKNVSLKDASDIVKERVQDLKDVVEDAWGSVQTAASQINEDHIQPMVKKVNRFVKRRWSEAGTGRTCRGKNCKGRRRNNPRGHCNVNGKRARKTNFQQSVGNVGKFGGRNNRNVGKNAKNLNIKHQPATVKSRNVEEQKNQNGRNLKPKGPTRVQTEAVVTPKKANKKGGQQPEPKQAEIKKQRSSTTDPEKPSENFMENIDNIHTKEIKREYSSSKRTQEDVGMRNIPESGKISAKSPPPVLNIEKVLDSMDMSCGGEVRCVENHKIDAARLLKEMISYRQWLWEQRFRKDVDEVEDFMEELEEFIDEEDVDDEDIEDLKDEFEDMVEDIQKTTKKFFRKQERQTQQKASNSGGSSVTEKVKGKQLGQRLQKELKDKAKPKKGFEKQKKKEKMKGGKMAKEEVGKDVDGNKLSSKGTRATETVHTVTFNPQELPSVQMQNSSQQTMSTSDVEDEQKDEEGVSLEAVVMSPARGEADKVFHEKKQMGGGYINTDEWFFRRAHDRQRRRKENPDASWYFERFHSWEEERKNNGRNDWYFQWGRNREESRDCPTQPWHCEWAHDESVVTLWEMYKWLTERFTFRADLRAWELEDQINWFLKKP